MQNRAKEGDTHRRRLGEQREEEDASRRIHRHQVGQLNFAMRPQKEMIVDWYAKRTTSTEKLYK